MQINNCLAQLFDICWTRPQCVAVDEYSSILLNYGKTRAVKTKTKFYTQYVKLLFVIVDISYYTVIMIYNVNFIFE